MSLKGANYPKIRPALDLRFAQTKRLDPRITFSRASVGTYYDVNGVLRTAPAGVARFDHNPTTGESLGLLVEEARTNNFSHSSTFESSAWTKQDLTVVPYSALAPDGTYTAAKLVPNTSNTTHRLQRVIGGNTPSRFSIYLKAGEYTICDMYSWNVDFAARINLADGSISTAPDIPKPSTGFSIQSIGNGWYRVTLYGSNDTTINNPVIIAPNSYGSFAGNNASGIYAWGAQLEDGTFSTSYIPTSATFTSRSTTATYYGANGVIQTAGVDVARSNAYLPDANGAMQPAGLLLEGAGTNLLTYSEQFDNGIWTKSDVTVSSNVTIAPNGSTTADNISNNPDIAGWFRHNLSLNSSTTYTLSLYVKPLTANKLLAFEWSTNVAKFDLSTLTTSFHATASGILRIEPHSNGWYRISHTLNGVTQTPAIFLGNWGFTSENVSFSIWGAQLEASPYPTSYIPTTDATATRAADVSSSATVTRSADVASISGAHFNPLSSTFVFTEASFTSNSGDRVYATLHGTNGNNRLFYLNNFFTSGPDGQFTYTIPDVLANGSSANYALTFNYDGSITEKAYAKDGVLTPAATINGLRIPTIGLVFNFGANDSSMIPIKKTFKRITYWPIRLPDATLQRLTT